MTSTALQAPTGTTDLVTAPHNGLARSTSTPGLALLTLARDVRDAFRAAHAVQGVAPAAQVEIAARFAACARR